MFKILQSKISKLGPTFPAAGATAAVLKGYYGE